MTCCVRVVPHYVGRNCAGREVSPFSASAVTVEKSGRWTWEVTDARGHISVGLGRPPVATYAEALAVARRWAELSNNSLVVADKPH